MDNADRQIVKAVPNVFTFTGADGDDLRDIAMQLNNEWSFYLVKRVGDDAQLQALEETLEKVKEEGADRGSMAAVESLRIQPLDQRYPVASYTLKRSKTQQRVACEEIGKQIVTTIKNAILHIIEWVKKHLAKIPEYYQRLRKSAKQAQTEEILTTVKDFDKMTFRSRQELEKDEKASAHAEALREYFTVYADKISRDGQLLKNFGHAVKESDKLFGYMDRTSDELVQMIKTVVTGKWSTEDEMRAGTLGNHGNIPLLPFLRTFSKASTWREMISETYATYRDWAEESYNIDPYNFSDIVKRVRFLIDALSPDSSPYYFSDAVIEQLGSIVKKTTTALDATAKTVAQMSQGDRSRSGLVVIRRTAEKLTEALNGADLLGSLTEQQSNKSLQLLKILYLHLKNCEVTDNK